jgi:hypothetical protein
MHFGKAFTMKRSITVKVEEEVYHRARIWVAERDSSLSGVVQYCLENLPGLSLARGFHGRKTDSCTAEPSTESLQDSPSSAAINTETK